MIRRIVIDIKQEEVAFYYVLNQGMCYYTTGDFYFEKKWIRE